MCSVSVICVDSTFYVLLLQISRLCLLMFFNSLFIRGQTRSCTSLGVQLAGFHPNVALHVGHDLFVKLMSIVFCRILLFFF